MTMILWKINTFPIPGGIPTDIKACIRINKTLRCKGEKKHTTRLPKLVKVSTNTFTVLELSKAFKTTHKNAYEMT